MSKTGNTLRLGIARGVGIAIQLVSVPIVWDVIGGELLGVCYFLILLGRWVSLIDIGFSDGSQRLMTRAFDSGDERQGYSVFYTYVSLLLLHALVGFGLFVVLSKFVALPELPRGVDPLPLFLVGAAMFVAQYLQQGLSFYFNARRQFVYLAVSNGVQFLVSGVLALTLTLWLRRPEAYLAGFAIGYGGVFFVSLLLALKQARDAKVRPTFDKEAFRYCLGFGAKLYLPRVGSVTVGTFDRIAIGKILGPAPLTAYTNAARMPEAASELLPLQQTLLPDLTKAHMEGDRQFEALSEKGTRIALMVGCGLIFIPSSFGSPVLQVWLQDKFVPEMAVIMLLMGLHRAFETFFNGLAQVIIAHGTPHRITMLASVNIVAVLALSYPAATTFGLIGIATMRVLVQAVQFVPSCWYVVRTTVPGLRLWPWIGKLTGILVLASVGAVGGFYASQTATFSDHPWMVLIAAPLVMGAFFFLVDRLGFAEVPDAIKRRLRRVLPAHG
jgi:O-antigen/teichoic acid export membrane protein